MGLEEQAGRFYSRDQRLSSTKAPSQAGLNSETESTLHAVSATGFASALSRASEYRDRTPFRHAQSRSNYEIIVIGNGSRSYVVGNNSCRHDRFGFGVAIRPVRVAICIVQLLKVEGTRALLQMTRINSSDGTSRHPNWRTDFKFSLRSYSLVAQRLNLLMIIRDTHLRSDRMLRLTFTAPLVAKLRASQSRAGEDGMYED